MTRDKTLEHVDACIDAGTPLPLELQSRVRVQPRLRRATQALERMDLLLRDDIARAAALATPRVTARVLERLPAQPGRGRPLVLAGWAALAAAALVWIALLDTQQAEVEPLGPLFVQAISKGTPLLPWLDWSMPLMPERLLLEEAEHLASDTRRTADSLWARMPLTSLLAREER